MKLPGDALDKESQAIQECLFCELTTIVDFPELLVESGCVLEVDPKSNKFQLVAQTALATFDLEPRAITHYQSHLAGEVGELKKIIPVSNSGSQVDLTNGDRVKHRHFILPVIRQQKLLGALVLYLKAEHEFSEKEINTLKRFTQALSGLLFANQFFQEKQLSELVLERSNHGIILTDENLSIMWVNKTFEKITGYICNEIVGNKPSILSSGRHNKKFYTEMWRSLIDNGSWEGEIWNKRKNGDVFPELINIIALKNNQDEICHYAAIFKDISAIKKAEEKIYQLAYFDTLTGLANRRYFLQHLAENIKVSKRRNERLTLMYIDLDGFKNVNDTLGHHGGDQLLAKIGSRLKKIFREADFIARLGGDEFCVLISNNCDESNAATIADNCLDEIKKNATIEGHIIKPKVSIGIAYYPEDGSSSEELLKAADIAMYESKTLGKNRFTFYDKKMTLILEKRKLFEHDLQRALKRGEFELYYQPKVDLASGRMRGVEALIRWNHPRSGLITPKDFIPELESLSIIDRVGCWVMEAACTQLKQWHSAGFTDLTMAVNISPCHFEQAGFVSNVKQVVEKTKIDPSSLEIEITESMTHSLDISINTCLKIKAIGVRVAIDDFGTGYSSLSILSKLDINTLKIDKLFVDDLLKDTKMGLVLAGIHSLALGLGYDTVVEGVETKEQVELLRNLGYTTVQGCYFSKPVRSDRIPSLVNVDFCDSLKR